MNKPLISIITVVYNAYPTLERTIKSVLNQKKELFEYWIIDGGSSDGSIEIIRKYENQLAGWISEPDKGIYDAMNKGIDKARGKWLYFLGGDDMLRQDIIRAISDNLTPAYQIVYGDVLFDNGYHMRSFLGARTLFQNTIHHQSAFYNAAIFKDYRYDIQLTIVSEYDIHLRVYKEGLRTKYISIIVADCATGGASSALWKSLRETNRVRSRYVKGKWRNNALSVLLGIYYTQKSVRYLLYGHRV